MKNSTPVYIIAQCGIDAYTKQFMAISKVHNSYLFEGILNPSKLRAFTNKPDDYQILIDNKKWVRKYCVISSSFIDIWVHYLFYISYIQLNTEQNLALSKLYMSTYESLVGSKGFVGIINGCSGTFHYSNVYCIFKMKWLW